MRFLFKSLLLIVLFFFLGASLFALWVYFQMPSSSEIKGCLTTKMYQVKLCPGSKSYVPLKQVSPFLQRALIAAEDANFWSHRGFDWEAIEKSARENWKTGKFKRGGSTITQQLAKNMFLNRDKNLIRKGLEALITMKIEQTLTKKEILERYLNVVEFGKNLFGAKAAAQYYFSKHPKDLTVTESAFLVMILPNPIKYSASFHRKQLSPFAKKRIKRIINDLRKTGRISEGDYESALAQYANFFGPPPDLEPEPTADEIEDKNQDYEHDPTEDAL